MMPVKAGRIARMRRLCMLGRAMDPIGWLETNVV